MTRPRGLAPNRATAVPLVKALCSFVPVFRAAASGARLSGCDQPVVLPPPDFSIERPSFIPECDIQPRLEDQGECLGKTALIPMMRPRAADRETVAVRLH